MTTTYKYKSCPIVKMILDKDYTCAGNLEKTPCPYFKECPEQFIENEVMKKVIQLSPKVTLHFASIIKGGMKTGLPK